MLSELLKSLRPDHLLAPIPDQTTLMAMDQQEQIDAMGSALSQKRVCKVRACRKPIFENEHPIVAPVCSIESKKNLGILFADKVNRVHCPIGQVHSLDVADILEKDNQGQWFAAMARRTGRTGAGKHVHRSILRLAETEPGDYG